MGKSNHNVRTNHVILEQMNPSGSIGSESWGSKV